MVTNSANSTTNTTGADGAAIAFPSNPFVGLRPFNSGEALLFFGRGEQTVELLRRLHRDHFIAVVGSSGCGKSSLVRAGLIPKLRAGFLTEDRDRWLVAAMKPGDAPLRNLAAALIEVIPDRGGVEAYAEEIRAGGAQAVIEQLSPSLAHSDANLLLLVDQFEEIFRFGVESGKPERRLGKVAGGGDGATGRRGEMKIRNPRVPIHNLFRSTCHIMKPPVESKTPCRKTPRPRSMD